MMKYKTIDWETATSSTYTHLLLSQHDGLYWLKVHIARLDFWVQNRFGRLLGWWRFLLLKYSVVLLLVWRITGELKQFRFGSTCSCFEFVPNLLQIVKKVYQLTKGAPILKFHVVSKIQNKKLYNKLHFRPDLWLERNILRPHGLVLFLVVGELVKNWEKDNFYVTDFRHATDFI